MDQLEKLKRMEIRMTPCNNNLALLLLNIRKRNGKREGGIITVVLHVMNVTISGRPSQVANWIITGLESKMTIIYFLSINAKIV